MRREHAYAWIISYAGWLWLLFALVLHPPTAPLAIAAFTAYGVLAELWPANLRAGTVSIEAAFLIPAAILTGPQGAAASLAVSVLIASAIRRRPVRVWFFNGGQYAIAVLVAGFLSQHLFPMAFAESDLHIGALVVFFLIFLAINHLLVDGYFLLAHFNWQAAVLDGLGLDLLASFVTLPLGMGVVVAFHQYAWVGIFAIATPLVLMGYALHLQTDLRQRNRNLELLNGFYQVFAKAGGVEDILTALRDRLSLVFQNSLAYAGLTDVRGHLQTLPGSGFVPLEAGAAMAAESGRHLLLDSAQAAGLLASGAGGGIVLPIVTSRGLCGIVAFAWPYELQVGDEDRRLFDAARHLAMIACEKETLLRETERLAATDPRLPGLYNYRYLIARLEEGLARNRREETRLALIYIDLDGFKQYNDRLGHLAGDEVLREFANLLSSHTRQGDVAARYAGDEFVLLLHDADRARAEEVAARLRAEVEAFSFLTGFEVALGEVGLSFSFGVACDEGGTHDPRSLIDAADRAMYEDKRQKTRQR